MMKRMISAALAALLLLTALPISVRAAGGYTVSVRESKSVSNGSDVVITLDLSKSGETAYNAYDVSIAYDASRLTFKECTPADANARVEHTNGKIHIVGYGPEKQKTKPVAVFIFNAKAEGRASVQVTSAKIDRSSNAVSHNAPEAAKSPSAATITVLATYKVTLGEGLTADTLEAARGQDFTFKAQDYEDYVYTITARVDGKPVTVTDNKNGSYTIAGKFVTGEITVEAARSPKSYKVTITGQDVTGEKTAAYNKPYTFSLNRKTGFNYTVKVTIGGKAYTKYTLKNNTYTIPGTDITGDIVITVTKVKKNSGTGTKPSGSNTGAAANKGMSVQFTGSGEADVSGSKTAKKGTDYTFKIKQEEGYRYEVSVQIDGNTVTYTYDAEKDEYTIPGDAVTGNIDIVVTKFVVPIVTEYITLDGQSIYLILVVGKVPEGQVPKFDGQSMYRSEIYPGYTWLVQTSDSEEAVRLLAEEKITIADGKTEASAEYSGNVNRSTELDINDAQLAYDMYSAVYELEDVPVLEFLGADVNGDCRVNILDAEWILNRIRIQERGGQT